jgi:competence protein ComEA
VATSAGLSNLIDSRTQWEFPRFDDQTPQPDSDNRPPTKRAPRATRVGVSLIVGIVLVALGMSAVGVVVKAAGTRETLVSGTDSTPASPGALLPEGIVQPMLVVHVTGEVKNPGVIDIPEGARVYEAVEKAGGFTAEAQSDSVNLARFLVDGEHLFIPALGEDQPAAAVSGRVSLSLASSSELETLSGVGPTIAARIIAWREANGPFRHVDDVLAVSGIGPATLEGFRDQVVP